MRRLLILVMGGLCILSSGIKAENVEYATFGAGCFWCVEYEFAKLDGVTDVISGFSGGHVAYPTYEQVLSHETGHAEVAHITFDPDIISYAKLLDTFWAVHDPTQLNRQGVDVGPQYRSIILTHTPEQAQLAEASKAELQARKPYQNREIVTEIKPFEAFYPAEDYHQNYYKKNPEKAKAYERYKKMRGLGE